MMQDYEKQPTINVCHEEAAMQVRGVAGVLSRFSDERNEGVFVTDADMFYLLASVLLDATAMLALEEGTYDIVKRA